jgi:hypothetical protein
LQQQIIMPFIIMQQLHMPPCSMVHRFCIMLHAILSSQEQLMRMPPWHFSNFIVQRGTIIQLAGSVAVPLIPGELTPAVPMPITELRSITMFVISFTPLFNWVHHGGAPLLAQAGMIGRNRSPELSNLHKPGNDKSLRFCRSLATSLSIPELGSQLNEVRPSSNGKEKRQLQMFIKTIKLVMKVRYASRFRQEDRAHATAPIS